MSENAASEDMQRVGQLLRTKRVELGMTQSQAARASGWATTEISNLENGRRVMPRMDSLAKLCDLYGIDLNDLAEEAGWIIGKSRPPADDVHWELLGEVVMSIPDENRRRDFLKRAIAMARAERQTSLSRKAETTLLR